MQFVGSFLFICDFNIGTLHLDDYERAAKSENKR